MTLRWLTADGAVAAVIVGALVFWGAGASGVALLALFFVSGSLLTEWNERQRREKRQKRQCNRRNEAEAPLPPPPLLPPLRNARQVLANGGWAAAGALVVPWRPDLGWAVLLGSLATAQADTWATEIGAHAARPPRLITTARPVPAGTSGGVTPLGTGAGVLGATLLAGLGLWLGVPLRIAALGTLVGVFGMMVDSVLGATLEGDGRLDNDGVNLAATSVGALASVALTQVVGA